MLANKPEKLAISRTFTSRLAELWLLVEEIVPKQSDPQMYKTYKVHGLCTYIILSQQLVEMRELRIFTVNV